MFEIIFYLFSYRNSRLPCLTFRKTSSSFTLKVKATVVVVVVVLVVYINNSSVYVNDKEGKEVISK